MRSATRPSSGAARPARDILHALGFDRHDLYYEHHGRRELVTVNGGQVNREVFA